MVTPVLPAPSDLATLVAQTLVLWTLAGYYLYLHFQPAPVPIPRRR